MPLPGSAYLLELALGSALKVYCMPTPTPERRVNRWEHESVLETMQSRLDQAPEKMRIGRQTLEPPFGTLKSWIGALPSPTSGATFTPLLRAISPLRSGK